MQSGKKNYRLRYGLTISGRFGVGFFWQAYAPLMPTCAGTWYLPRMVDLQKVIEMLLLGELVDAREAYRLGMVYKTIPSQDLMSSVEDLIRKLLQYSPEVLHHTKHSIMKGLEQEFLLRKTFYP